MEELVTGIYIVIVAPKFKCQSDYKGVIIHPQKWPENFDCTNKKIVVIGSGATAVTIVPKLASKASHVTMLQRSPTYIGNFPSKDKIGAKTKFETPSCNAPTPAARLDSTTTIPAWKVADLSFSTSS